MLRGLGDRIHRVPNWWLEPILAGLLWYLLLVGTANPQQFFSWTVGLLIVAAVALPLLVTVPFLDGVAAAIVNLFIGSSAMQFGISVIGVLVFAGLTAWDTQKLKTMYIYGNFDGETAAKASVFGALELYLDFINIFMYLLQLFGRRD